MGKRKRRRLTEAFKQKAARLCLRDDRSIGQVARELDLTESALRNWVKQDEVDRGPNLTGALTRREDRTAHALARGAGVADPKKGGGLLRQGKCMRFACVHVEKANHAVRRLCRVLEVTPSGYYAWVQRQPSQRQRDNDRLKVRIRAVHATSRSTYGSPRVHKQLTQAGCAAERERVARLLRDMGLVGLPAKRFRHTTDSTHGQPVAPNVLARRFHAERPHQRWTTDITYIWTWDGWLYLAVVLDLCSRRVVEWALQRHLQTELALEALQVALERRVPAAGLVHHSDRGCQYAAAAYQRVLRDHSIVGSMSRKGDCWDNAGYISPHEFERRHVRTVTCAASSTFHFSQGRSDSHPNGLAHLRH